MKSGEMMQIQAIHLPLPLHLGKVNCYLISTGSAFFLIDSGNSFNRQEIAQTLTAAGCRPGDLKLIVITHGDFDHTGSAAALRREFGARIAIHANDAGMAELGDMFYHRKQSQPLIGAAAALMFGFRKAHRFTPDILLAEGYDLSEYGLVATIILIPGHSSGSIGILTAEGDLFCGDLLENNRTPMINSLIDDLPAAQASVERLKALPIRIIYPGHGKPFTLDELKQNYP